jgi:hypothetical protein
MIEPKFQKGDYIISRSCGDMGIIKGLSKKGYYQFEEYYGGMFKKLKDKGYELQINYQKFYELCTKEEKEKLDEIIKEKGGK